MDAGRRLAGGTQRGRSGIVAAARREGGHGGEVSVSERGQIDRTKGKAKGGGVIGGGQGVSSAA
jgi:hypothetical protein